MSPLPSCAEFNSMKAKEAITMISKATNVKLNETEGHDVLAAAAMYRSR